MSVIRSKYLNHLYATGFCAVAGMAVFAWQSSSSELESDILIEKYPYMPTQTTATVQCAMDVVEDYTGAKSVIQSDVDGIVSAQRSKTNPQNIVGGIVNFAVPASQLDTKSVEPLLIKGVSIVLSDGQTPQLLSRVFWANTYREESRLNDTEFTAHALMAELHANCTSRKSYSLWDNFTFGN